MKVVIIKYNSGNVQSVQFALQRIGVDSFVTDDATLIQQADKVIFPGVGHAYSAMEYLKERALDKIILDLKQPVLGICLGMQLLCTHSEEGDTRCMGVFNSNVKLFSPSLPGAMELGEHWERSSGRGPKIPQIGWNNIYNYRSVLFKGLPENAFVYTVHSYYAALADDTVAATDYILPYSAALQKDNFYAVQFHPEKSGAIGETILKNFIELT